MRADCWRTSDNRYFDAPAKMADGRLFTDQRSPGMANGAQAREYNNRSVMSGKYGWRQRIEENGRRLHEEFLAEATARAGIRAEDVTPHDTMLPEQSFERCEKWGCDRYVGELAGLGQGRLYDDRAPSQYVPASLPKNRCARPVTILEDLTPAQLADVTAQSRPSVPQGGDPFAYLRRNT